MKPFTSDLPVNLRRREAMLSPSPADMIYIVIVKLRHHGPKFSPMSTDSTYVVGLRSTLLIGTMKQR